MSDPTPTMNAPEARAPTGEIKDQTSTTPPTPETTTPAPAPAPTTEVKADGPAPKPSLANEKPAEAQGAPEKYEAFKVPEGFELPEDQVKEVSAMFKDLNLSQEAGQKLIDYYTKSSQEALEAPFKLWQETQEKWVSEVRSDPDIGPRLDTVKTTISKAIDGLGDAKLASDFRAAMDFTGAGNNLAFIKTFWKLAQMVTEPGHVAGTGPSPLGQKAPGSGPPTAARALYPNLP